jgi:site-specific recombinase XerC
MAHVGKGTKYFSGPFPDRHGKPTYYYRRPGFRKIRLKAEPNTAAMDRAYYAAEREINKLAEAKAAAKASGKPVDPDRPMVICKPTTNPEYVKRFGDTAEPGVEGTLRWATDLFERSDYLLSTEKWTRRAHVRNLRYVCALRTKDGKDAYGELLLDGVEREHVLRVHQSLKTEPARADLTVKSIRRLFNWVAEDQKLKLVNPVKNIPWMWDENAEHGKVADASHMAKLRAYYPIGTPQRACFELMLRAGVRVSCAHLLGPFNRKHNNTELHWTEYKGSHSTVIDSRYKPDPKPRKLEIDPDLQRVLDASKTECGRFVYYVENGKQIPYANGRSLCRSVRRWCKNAGLPEGVVSHAMRRGLATLLGDAAIGERDANRVLGWNDGSKMYARYSRIDERRAQRRALAVLPKMEAA